MDGYVVTREVGKTEVACKITPRNEVGTQEQAQIFLDNFASRFPSETYRLYKLERVVT